MFPAGIGERWGLRFLCVQGLPSAEICAFPWPVSSPRHPPRESRYRVTRAEAVPLLVCNFLLPPSAVYLCVASFQMTHAEVSSFLATAVWKEPHKKAHCL